MHLGATVRDTGIPVDAIFAATAEGLTPDQIVTRHPALTIADVMNAYRTAATVFRTDPILALEPLPLQIHATTTTPLDGLQLRITAGINGNPHALSPTTVLDASGPLELDGRTWRLARGDEQLLRTILSRGREDAQGAIRVRNDDLPSVLLKLRSSAAFAPDESTASISIETRAPTCVVQAEPGDRDTIRVSWWFERGNGLIVSDDALAPTSSRRWLNDGTEFFPAPTLPRGGPDWLTPRHGRMTLRPYEAIRFLRDELPLLRAADGIRLNGECRDWLLDESPWVPRAEARLDDTTLVIETSFDASGQIFPAGQVSREFRLLREGATWRLRPQTATRWLDRWAEADLDPSGHTRIDDPDQIAALAGNQGADLQALGEIVTISPEVRALRVVDEDLRPIIRADAAGRDQIGIEVGFAAGEHVLSWHDLSELETPGFQWRQGQLVHVDPSVAERTAARLRDLKATTDGSRILIPRDEDGDDLLGPDFRSLRDLGDLVVSPRLRRLAELEAVPAVPTVRISLGPNGLIWLDPCYLVDGREFPFDTINIDEDVVELPLEDARPKIAVGNHEQLQRKLASLAEPDALGRFTVSIARFGEVVGLLENVATIEYADDFQRILDGLRDFAGIKTQPPPPGFQGALYPYQQRGYEWLCFLRDYGLHGLLADDMGLGKTAQSIALMLRIATEVPKARILVVCPRGVLGTWEKAIRDTFAPGLKTVRHHGVGRTFAMDLYEDIGRPLVFLTTYACLVRDKNLLAPMSWELVVLDEAQTIKNFATKSAQAARTLHSRTRLALSGTPVENRLAELWSIFDFVLPGYLGSYRSFRRLYEAPVIEEGSTERRERLVQKIRPFVLRRRKREVAPELPEKIDVHRPCDLTREQVKLYRDVLASQGQLAVTEIRAGATTGRMHALAAITKLKQICCHPALVSGDKQRLRHRSGKFEAFLQLIEEIRDTGEKTLVFSQYTSMLTLLDAQLRSDGHRVYLLTGDTRNRDAVVDRFTADETPAVFLISLHAGGVGLNLQCATNVIHYDRWWNPAREAQATDRAHRIGQTQPVEVFRLDTIGTIEERIDALQRRKADLFTQVVDTDTDPSKTLTADELISLFELPSGEGVDDLEDD